MARITPSLDGSIGVVTDTAPRILALSMSRSTRSSLLVPLMLSYTFPPFRTARTIYILTQNYQDSQIVKIFI